MIILLSGKPGIGKSTLIRKVIDNIAVPSRWVVTKELLSAEGRRVGFQAQNSEGQEQIISHKTDIQSTTVIGQNAVDLIAVDQMFGRVLHDARNIKKLTLIDEIGPIQMLSSNFASALAEVFRHPQQLDLIATIHYNDERLEKYRTSDASWFFMLDEKNRETVTKAIMLCAHHLETINSLSSTQKQCVLRLIEEYVADAKIIQIEKLFNNAIYYVGRKSITQQTDSQWKVEGGHGIYEVQTKETNYSCNCDLNNGLGSYKNNGGECSHIQAVKLSLV